MGGKIASLYAELTANTTKFSSGLKGAKDDLTKFSKDAEKQTDQAGKGVSGLGEKFGAMGGKIMAAAGIVGGFAMALSEVYDIAKQGAALENVERKFTRLSESIHTTSDALLGDLRTATKGTLSDAELMTSATDLMSLGLVKTHGDTVRLGKVIAGLGMDMNQLVLTMANQTTMRFDQLGVSVVGFDEKVKALKDTGMNANDAFNEAFLQQAEEQLARVGNAADTDVGAFMRLEASAANLGDAVKRKLAPPLADAADAMYTLITWSERINGALNTQKENLLTTTTSYDEYVEANIDAAIAAGKLGKNFRDSLLYQKKNKDSLFDVTKELNLFTRAQYYGTQASIQAGDATREGMRANAEYGKVAEETGGLIRGQAYDWEAVAQSGQNAYMATWEASRAAGEAAIKFGELQTAQGQLIDAQKNWQAGVGTDIAALFEAQGLKGEDLYTVLGIVDEMQGSSTESAARYKDELALLVKEYDPTKPDAFRTALGLLNDKFDPFKSQIEKSTELMIALNDQIDKFDGAHTAVIKIVVDKSALADAYNNISAGSGGESITPPGDAAGSPVYAGSAYWVGERGPEPFIPAVDGRILSKEEAKDVLTSDADKSSGNTYILQQHITSSQTGATQAGFRRLQILAGV